MSPTESPESLEPVQCKSCNRWLTDIVSIKVERGPTCFRRAVAANLDAAAQVVRELQLTLDLDGLPAVEPRRHSRRELATA